MESIEKNVTIAQQKINELFSDENKRVFFGENS